MELYTNPPRRFNILTGEWVLVTPHRTKRPWQGKTEKSLEMNGRNMMILVRTFRTAFKFDLLITPWAFPFCCFLTFVPFIFEDLIWFHFFWFLINFPQRHRYSLFLLHTASTISKVGKTYKRGCTAHLVYAVGQEWMWFFADKKRLVTVGR